MARSSKSFSNGNSTNETLTATTGGMDMSILRSWATADFDQIDAISARVADEAGISSVLSKWDQLGTLADEVQRLTA
jgi:hypothetical protein